MRTATPLLAATLAVGLVTGCQLPIDLDPPARDIDLQNYSSTPALVKNVMPGVEVFTMLSSDDRFLSTPDFVFAGSPDGAGLIKNPNGTYYYVTNNEDNYSVSRITLDRNLRPIAGTYLMDSDEGLWRKCSATMATPEEHGFGPVFLTASESGDDNINFMVDPETGESRLLPALGAWNTENLVPLPSTAYPGQTVVILGDDDSGASTGYGQLPLYVSDTVGDLDNGRLYVAMFPDGIEREQDMRIGQEYRIRFEEIDNSNVAAAPSEFVQMVTAMNPAAFGRIEDLDYRKGSDGREIYFNVTGTNSAPETVTVAGRVYRLTLDENDPTQGTLEVLLDGDDPSSPAYDQFQNPDNIMVGENYVYVQEDPNGYGTEDHDAYIYQYDIATGALNVVMELDRRPEPKYSRGRDGVSVVPPEFGDWEYGALVRISDETGVEDLYTLNIQPHTWRDPQLAGVDGGQRRALENQAGQVLYVKGLPY